MKIVQKLTLITAMVATVFALNSPLLLAETPFSGARKQACKGANLSNTDDNCHEKSSGDTIDSRIKTVVNLLTVIVGVAAVIMIIINGLKYITSNGDSNSISSAKSGIIYALVGLIIVALSQVIVRFILTRV